MNFIYVMIAAAIITFSLYVYICGRRSVSVIKCAALTLITLAVGYLGCRLMMLPETGTLHGRSFYGTIFLLPMLMPIVARLMSVSKTNVMDTCGVAVAFVAMAEKICCAFDGCCKGRLFTFMSAGVEKQIRFPSQITEAVMGLVIGLVLLRWAMQGRFRGHMYPLFMILYGIARFLLNWLRETKPFVWFLPAGNFWSIISVAVGILLIRKRVFRERKRRPAQRRNMNI